jgi:hypothetical protein
MDPIDGDALRTAAHHGLEHSLADLRATLPADVACDNETDAAQTAALPQTSAISRPAARANATAPGQTSPRQAIC